MSCCDCELSVKNVTFVDMKITGIRKVTIAPDKFKGTLTSAEAADAMAAGVRRAVGDCDIRKVMMADGGEGTSEVVGRLSGYIRKTVSVVDALMRPAEAYCMVSPDGDEVLIDSSAVIGLAMIAGQDRSPWRSSSFGLGRAVRELTVNAEANVTVGIGGTATVDAGIGFLQGLGAGIYCHGMKMERPVTAVDISDIDIIDFSPVLPLSKRITGISDVDVPLSDTDGGLSMLMFAPQKGVAPDELPMLQRALDHLAGNVGWYPYRPDFRCRYGGAGGGLGFALAGVMKSAVIDGAEAVIERVRLFDPLPDLVITGEGRFDRQSFQGKVAGAIFRESERREILCMVVAGSVEPGLSFPWLFAAGQDVPSTSQESYRRLADAVEQAIISFFR